MAHKAKSAVPRALLISSSAGSFWLAFWLADYSESIIYQIAYAFGMCSIGCFLLSIALVPPVILTRTHLHINGTLFFWASHPLKDVLDINLRNKGCMIDVHRHQGDARCQVFFVSSIQFDNLRGKLLATLKDDGLGGHQSGLSASSYALSLWKFIVSIFATALIIIFASGLVWTSDEQLKSYDIEAGDNDLYANLIFADDETVRGLAVECIEGRGCTSDRIIDIFTALGAKGIVLSDEYQRKGFLFARELSAEGGRQESASAAIAEYLIEVDFQPEQKDLSGRFEDAWKYLVDIKSQMPDE